MWPETTSYWSTRAYQRLFTSLRDALRGHMQVEEHEKFIELDTFQLLQAAAQGVWHLVRHIRKTYFSPEYIFVNGKKKLGEFLPCYLKVTFGTK